MLTCMSFNQTAFKKCWAIKKSSQNENRSEYQELFNGSCSSSRDGNLKHSVDTSNVIDM